MKKIIALAMAACVAFVFAQTSFAMEITYVDMEALVGDLNQNGYPEIVTLREEPQSNSTRVYVVDSYSAEIITNSSVLCEGHTPIALSYFSSGGSPSLTVMGVDEDSCEVIVQIVSVYGSLIREIELPAEEGCGDCGPGYCPDEYTKLLIHSDNEDGSTVFVDSSSSEHTVTSNYGAHHDTAQAKFGSSSMEFYANYLTIPDSSDFEFGTGDFTVEMWVYIKGHDQSELSSFIGQGNTSNNEYWRFLYIQGDLCFELEYGTGIYRSWSPSLDTWYHIAVTRSGNDFRLFVDGTQLGSAQTITTAVENPSETLDIGRAAGGTNYRYFNGYIDEVRISNIARWTENFTPIE
ncbi:MAG: LamG domain-containing protein [Thermodesulfobacteriota bacterium]|nr:LamG domain-containing protein [Thermodesulfobacteriota bacterium]